MTRIRTPRTIFALFLAGACVVGAGFGVGMSVGGTPRPVAPQRNPDAPDYDPIALKQALGNRPEGIVDIFAEEPRQPGWASQMERALTEVIGAELAGRKTRASVAFVECRTLVCVSSLTLPTGASPAERTAVMLALQTPPVAGAVVFTSGPGIHVHLGFTPLARSVAAWRAQYSAARSEFAARLRKKQVMDRRLYPAGSGPL